MINQKMISLKLDVDQLQQLDELCSSIGCNRNKMINFAVFMVNQYLRISSHSALVAAYSLGLSAFDD